MKAQNLTISVPSPQGCNKKCPYCVSDMTGHVKPDWDRMKSKFDKVVQLAKNAGVNNVLITSKGEPLMYPEYYAAIAKTFNMFPLEIQTNGKLLLENIKRHDVVLPLEYYHATKGNTHLNILHHFNVDVIAISIDKEKEFEDRKNAIKKAIDMGFVVRLCVNINTFLKKYLKVEEVFDYCKELGIQQVLFRKLTIPEGSKNEWIHKFAIPHQYGKNGYIRNYTDFDDQLDDIILNKKLKSVRTLITGEKLYEYEGIGFTTSDHCIQERSNGENDIRSLIFLEDGHLYTSWNSRSPMF